MDGKRLSTFQIHFVCVSSDKPSIKILFVLSKKILKSVAPTVD